MTTTTQTDSADHPVTSPYIPTEKAMKTLTHAQIAAVTNNHRMESLDSLGMKHETLQT